MITSIHALIYSDDAPATRAFLRDVLALPYVEAHEGWLIFGTGRSELGVHPVGQSETGSSQPPRPHQISMMCDDIEASVAELRLKGAEFRGEPEDRGYGIVVMMAVPGAEDIMLYQPRHPVAYNLELS